jgi:hypothetical protein
LQQLTKTPHKGSAQVLVRFGLRLVIMAAFAAFGSVGFGRSLVALLWMSAILCAVVGGMRRELPLAPDLNHWDEMAAYGALCALASGLNQHL